MKAFRMPGGGFGRDALVFDDYVAIDFSLYNQFARDFNRFLDNYAPIHMSRPFCYHETSQAPFNPTLDTSAALIFSGRLDNFSQQLQEDLHNPLHKPQSFRPSTMQPQRARGERKNAKDLRDQIPDGEYRETRADVDDSWYVKMSDQIQADRRRQADSPDA